LKSPNNRAGRKISEYFKSQQEPGQRKPGSSDNEGDTNGKGNNTYLYENYPGAICTHDSNSSNAYSVSHPVDTGSQTIMTGSNIQQLESRASLMPPPSDSAAVIEEMKRANDQLHSQFKERESTLARDNEKINQKYGECQAELKTLLLEKASQFSKSSRERCNNNKLRLGQYTTKRSGAHFNDEWNNGYAFREHQQRVERFKQAKEGLENEQKLLRQKRRMVNGPTPKKENKKNDDSNHVSPTVPDPQGLHELEEILKIKALAIKKEEIEIQAEIDQLQQECQLHMRETKRIQAEDDSRFKDNPSLKNGRYLLLNLIGKGGFSEVHKAYDFHSQKYVACKVHQLAREWKDEKRTNYLKHAVREYEIQKSLNHPHIVSLYDVFEIDQMSFCTVLEYCHGNDLDFYLKQHKSLREQEARCIVMQVVSSLFYLNRKKQPVIHYDLKPGNILLYGKGDFIGNLKITDFGLSKIMEEQHSDGGMELTSQGAGTYWYLPPECFTESPKISSKVDVWSVGVIFYQCLYGKKPFGNNMPQDAILRCNTILKAKEVEFPAKPHVSPEAKSFIRRCLEYRADLRADVLQLAEDSYLKQAPKRTKERPAPQHIADAPPSPTVFQSAGLNPAQTSNNS